MASKRPRTTSVLAIFSILGSSLVPLTASNEESFQNNPGSQYTSQECAVRRQRRRKINVSGVSLLCDSTQNNDENNRQNSLTCRPGDQAKAAISFDIRNMGGSSTIFIDFTSRALGKLQRVHNHSNVCNFANLVYWGDDQVVGDDLYASATSTVCPLRDGPYTLFTTFTVPTYTKDTDFEFTPALRVDFYNEDRKQIGCVETGTLAEVSYRKKRERQGQRFFVLSFFLFCLVAAFCLLGHRRRRKQGEHATIKRQASMMRRFHYVQTTRSGEIAPVVSSSESGSFSHSNSERMATLPSSIPEVE